MSCVSGSWRISPSSTIGCCGPLTDLEETNSRLLEAVSRGQDSGDELLDLDLPRLLTDQLLLENSALVSRLTPLLEPGELAPALANRCSNCDGGHARAPEELPCRHLLEVVGSGRRRLNVASPR